MSAGPTAAAAPGPLRSALEETGAIGATVRQLARRLGTAPDRIAAGLVDLERQGDVRRMGRGLYVLRGFDRLLERNDFTAPAEFTERFRRENGLSLGSYRGPITFRANENTPVHRWWPYVQGYSAEFVREVLGRSELPRGSVVLDPFAGSGTTLVEARRAGARAVGWELLAPAVLSARVKTRFELSPAALREAAARTARAARRRPAGMPPFLRATDRQFDPAALRDLTRLRDALPAEGRPVADAVRLAFGRILIPSSRLHRSPCLGYARRPAVGGPSPIARFDAAAEQMADDLAALAPERHRWGPAADVRVEDARRGSIRPGSVDLVVTSPPYVNGLDYVMNYKLDLAWLGYARSYADLDRLRRAEVACDNLPRDATRAYLDPTGAPDPWLEPILRSIERNVAAKPTYRRHDVHAIVHRYFADLDRVIARVREALRPGARSLWVVGDSLLAGAYIPGDLLLARIGERRGLVIESVEVARRRRSGQRRSFELRESIVALRRPRSAG